MSYGPIYNPPVPFSTHFHSGVNDGTVVVVAGSIPHSADRFSVNFQCGHGDNDDIAFHFNPRFDEKLVVCNTMEHKNWGKEERKKELPFHHGQQFEIRILVTSCDYKVSVNRNHFVEYHHRLPLHRVNTLTVKGSVCLTSVETQAQGCGFPQPPFPGGHMQNPPPFNPGQCPPASYAIPFQTKIHGGLFPSKVIVIRGAVAAHHPQRFHINLNFCGGIAFHFNPRFKENTIVRNSKLNNSWGTEERQLPCGGLCFTPGQSFVIEIVCEHHHFRVNVNGSHVCNFNHRVSNLQQIDSLQVEGDVVLHHVQI
ncbi:galectin-9-like isoform 2-T2 [Anomaloglossus baeobatrachus]|uniref:galectin-9 isoform X2 n=1 Tax=Anomaloglossus baeobatrachus TaxID=238106 RepID=UPI003F4FCF38